MIAIVLLILVLYGIGMTFLANYAWTYNKKKYRLLEEENDLLTYWLQKKLDGIDIEGYLKEKRISSVAFYKFNSLSEMLYMELEKYVDIKYCIDEDADNIWEGMGDSISIIKLEDAKKQEVVDLLIISETKENIHLLNNMKNHANANMIMWAYEIIKEF